MCISISIATINIKCKTPFKRKIVRILTAETHEFFFLLSLIRQHIDYRSNPIAQNHKRWIDDEKKTMRIPKLNNQIKANDRKYGISTISTNSNEAQKCLCVNATVVRLPCGSPLNIPFGINYYSVCDLNSRSLSLLITHSIAFTHTLPSTMNISTRFLFNNFIFIILNFWIERRSSIPFCVCILRYFDVFCA